MPHDPRTVRNTTTDEASHLAVLLDGMSGNSGRAIEEMEANGQRELVNSDVIPVDGADQLTEFGFVLGDQVPGDKLFRYATLPAGWAREGSDHAMWSYLLDEHGRRRVSIFYKAAFYDRDAHCGAQSLVAYLRDVAAGAQPLVLDDVWATREAIETAVAQAVEREAKEAAEFRRYDMEAAAKRCDESAGKLRELLKLVAP